MTYPTRLTTLLLTAAFGLTASCALAGSLKDLGKSASYPFKKGAHNAGKTLRTEAGHASKGINHTGQAVTYPIRKAGVNTSKTAHKVKKP
ncbi:MAG: hypothetical protein M3Y13_07530 [Armatimonadota bacterium]|nr:hypothetical protein [Armatimonadota bacterium]